ncbi:MAG: hypothetical protein HFE77_05155 [Clostridiales bacterium]|nr:hypothetical protein [Clostridiales bacterium]
MIIPFSDTAKAASKSLKSAKNISWQRKVFHLYKSMLLLCAVCLCIMLCACAQSPKPFGMYQNGPFTVEFAYSKTFLTNSDLPVSTAKEEENANMIEGWYTMEEDKIICQYTQTKDDKSIKYNLTFSYDKANDSLTLIEAHLPEQHGDNNYIWSVNTSQGVYKKIK